MINKIRDYCERRGFEVCNRLGDRIGIRPSVVRLYFIYISFITMGSPLLLYFFLAFWIRAKDYVQSSRTSVLDL
ncbi:MAG TPA: PspC family transcriptional regulator [Cryomorphaceae bacterium]|nr:PspC family transcriptional regulator [Owenweeksia sp.]HAD96496.1 PspC family transcriptional regulator [Cryomorphaceae bacterium]HBF18835.1 PspC family transcriptional regulator [Cryomorphaceae bacterium]HCQ14888.1 PspC family transcriptional regulator [Cryomorphaceae bacterium]